MASQKFEEILKRFRSCTSDPRAAFRKLRDNSGKELIGYTMGDVPLELIHAAGLTPVGVVGSHETIGDAAVYLPSFCCSLMRSTLDMGLNEGANSLSGMVVGHICDTTRDFSGIWQRHVKMPFFHDWMPPKQRKRLSARTYIFSELDRMKRNLEDFIGHKILDSDLESSLALYENLRGILGVLKTKALSDRGPIGAFDFYTVLKASHFMDANSYSKMVMQLLKAIEDLTDRKSEPKMPILMSGKIPEPLEVIKILEDGGGMIVDDDFLWGSRVIRQVLPSEGSPIERMANRFLNGEPFPGYLYESFLRRDFLFNLAESSNARAIIFWNIKFCEPYGFDYPDLKKAFREKGVPTFLIETELQPSSMAQLRTRLEAFMESL